MTPRRPTPGDRRDRLRDVNWFVHVPRHWLETRTARRLQTPRARLILLVATVVLAALYAVALAVDDPGGTFFGALVLFVVVASLALLAGGPTVCAFPDTLDERELALRGHVMGLAFNVSAGVSFLVILGTAVLARPVIAGSAETVDPSRLPTVMMAPLLFALLVHSVVPIAVLTWQERDRSPERELPPLDEDPVPGARPDGPPPSRSASARAAAPVDPTATIAPDGAGRPVTHDFPVVDDPAATDARRGDAR